MLDLVLSNGNLITMNDNNDILYNKDTFINDGKIIAIKETSSKKKLDCKNNYDVTGKYLLPGFINTHTHIFQTPISRSVCLLEFLIDHWPMLLEQCDSS